MRLLISCLVASLGTGVAAGPMPPDAYRAVNGVWVFPESPDRFYIPWQGDGRTAFFCAAGDYVKRRLRASGSTPIYRLSEPPRRSGEGLRFSLDPVGATMRTGVIVLQSVGPANSFSVNNGLVFCEQSRRR
jgi:hypothetical protein